MVRLTVRVDPSPLLRSAYYDFVFGVCLTLDYDYMCSETQEKNYLHPTASSRGITGMKRAFLGPLTMRKMGFEYQRIKFHWKKWVKIFTVLRVRTYGADPPSPPYNQPDRKISVLFDDFTHRLVLDWL